MNYKEVKEYWDKHDKERKAILEACKETAVETLVSLGDEKSTKSLQDGIVLGYYYAKYGCQQNFTSVGGREI